MMYANDFAGLTLGQIMDSPLVGYDRADVSIPHTGIHYLEMGEARDFSVIYTYALEDLARYEDVEPFTHSGYCPDDMPIYECRESVEGLKVVGMSWEPGTLHLTTEPGGYQVA